MLIEVIWMFECMKDNYLCMNFGEKYNWWLLMGSIVLDYINTNHLSYLQLLFFD